MRRRGEGGIQPSGALPIRSDPRTRPLGRSWRLCSLKQAQTRTVGCLQPSLGGRYALADVLAQPLCTRRHSPGPPAHTTCASRASVGSAVRMSQADGNLRSGGEEA